MKIKGFTLIELMVVIAIIGILVVVIIPKITSDKNEVKGNDTEVTKVR